jgi:RNA polymerase sporulation-specific sigma factor
MDDTSVLTPENVAALIAKSQAGDKEAREVLIEKNLGLVHHIVRRFAGRGTDTEDLFQIGTIGLIKAIDKFDLSLGLKFSTYAVPMITGEIKRFLRDDGMVKISRGIKENAIKVKMAVQQYQKRTGKEPEIEEISNETGLTQEDIVIAMEADVSVESIYSSVYQDDGSESCLADRLVQGENGFIGSKAVGQADPEKEKLIDRLFVNQMIGSLEAQERQLIYMRYYQNRTQVEIAEIMGISQVQVSRMEKKILKRMRERM